MSTDELNVFLASYLVVRRENGIDLVSRLSAFEVYSADNLHKLSHCRLNGNSTFYPKSSLGQVYLHIGNEIDEFVDVPSKAFHLAREGSSIIKGHGGLLPSLRLLVDLCQAVILHGHCDAKRCPGQRRAYIGNGGLNLPNGVPSLVVDGGFRKKIRDDPSFCLEEIQKTIGSLTEFLWKTMASLQERAEDLHYGVHCCTNKMRLKKMLKCIL